MKSIVCLVDSAQGVYVPEAFVDLYDADAWGIADADAEILRAGPDHADYWETWANVEDRAYLVDNGLTYHLHHDGDLFAVAYDALTDEEYRAFFGEERH